MSEGVKQINSHPVKVAGNQVNASSDSAMEKRGPNPSSVKDLYIAKPNPPSKEVLLRLAEKMLLAMDRNLALKAYNAGDPDKAKNGKEKKKIIQEQKRLCAQLEKDNAELKKIINQLKSLKDPSLNLIIRYYELRIYAFEGIRLNYLNRGSGKVRERADQLERDVKAFLLLLDPKNPGERELYLKTTGVLESFYRKRFAYLKAHGGMNFLSAVIRGRSKVDDLKDARKKLEVAIPNSTGIILLIDLIKVYNEMLMQGMFGRKEKKKILQKIHDLLDIIEDRILHEDQLPPNDRNVLDIKTGDVKRLRIKYPAKDTIVGKKR